MRSKFSNFSIHGQNRVDVSSGNVHQIESTSHPGLDVPRRTNSLIRRESLRTVKSRPFVSLGRQLNGLGEIGE